MPMGMPGPGGRSPWEMPAGTSRGSSRTAGAGGPARLPRPPRRRRPWRRRVPCRRCTPSMRGSAARKWSLSGVWPRPGTPGGDNGGGLAVELGVQGVAEPEFEAAEQLVLERGAHLHVAGGGEDDVDAVAEAARGDVGDDRFERLVVVVKGPQPSMTRKTSPQGWSGEVAVGAPAAVGARWSRCRGRGRTPPAASRMPETSATVRRTRSGSRREATPPTCGRSGHRRQGAAAEVESVELDFLRACG